MEAVIVAGGLGTRMWPLTERRPKQLLPVAGVPFAAHQITRLAAAGVDHIVFATSYRAEEFEILLGDGSDYGIRLSYVREVEPLGTGGAIRNVASVLTSLPDDPVIVVNGDALSDHDIAAQIAQWRDRRADVSLHLVTVDDPRAYGSVPTDSTGKVTEFAEKSPEPTTAQINAGCYVFRRELIDQIPTGRVVSIEQETFPQLLAEHRTVIGQVDSSYWLDVGSPEAVVRASRDLVLGVVASPAVSAAMNGALVDPSAQIAPGAVVVEGSSIGPGAVVSDGAVVRASIVMAFASIGPRCQITESVIGEAAVLEDGAQATGSAVGDEAVIGVNVRLPTGSKIACGSRVDLDLDPEGDRQGP